MLDKISLSYNMSNQKNDKLYKTIVPMIFRGAGCLSFFNTSYTILQFYHLQVQIKFRFLNPPNERDEEKRRGGTGQRQLAPPLRRAFKRRVEPFSLHPYCAHKGRSPLNTAPSAWLSCLERRGRIYVAARQPAAPLFERFERSRL